MPTKMQKETTLTPLGFILLVAGQLMPQMDFSIVNVALEEISTTLHASHSTLAFIVTLYGLAFSVSLAIAGRLGDRFGRKTVFMMGIGLFGLTSLFCGWADSIFELIIARIFQGISAALILPQILATIHVSLQGKAHSRAIGIYGSVGGLSFVIGQVLGGWLVSANLFGMGWRNVFYLNLPVCLTILHWGRQYIPNTVSEKIDPLDLQGISIFAGIVFLILLAISIGPDFHWAWPIWSMLFITLPLGWYLYRLETSKELKGQSPFLPPALFSRPKVRAGILSLMLLSTTFGGFMFVVALTLQSGFHWTALQSGNGFVALGGLYFLGSLAANHLAKLFKSAGYSGVILTGAILNIIGYLMLYYIMQTQKTSLTVFSVFIPFAIVGLANAFVVNSSIRLFLSDVPAKFAGIGSAVMTTLQQATAAVGASLTGAAFTQNISVTDPYHLTSLLAGLSILSLLMIVLLVFHIVGLIAVRRRYLSEKESV